MTLDDFNIDVKIGEGAFSTVYKARRKTDDLDYAIKIIDIGKLSEKEKFNALNEIRLLASIKNPYIIKFKESFYEEDKNKLW